MNSIDIVYKAVPTVSAFHNSKAEIRGIMGPIGSGKSVGSVIEMFDKCCKQKAFTDGVRRSKWGVIRNTYPELKSTTIKTFEEWIPNHVCRVRWDSPISARLYMKLGDGTIVDAEFLFISLDRPSDAKKLLSLELTGGWMNEAREQGKETLDMLLGRVGRFPSKRLGGPSWSGIIMDTNPPDDDHWWYNLAEELKPEGHEFFSQPPAILKDGNKWIMNPDAENVDNQPLGGHYWLRQVHGKDPQWIRVYLEGKYGTIQDGRPIYPEFNDNVHVDKDNKLEPMPMTNLVIGFDFGLTPACCIGQVNAKGQLHIFDEIVTPEDTVMGIDEFCRDIVMPFLAINYSEFPMSQIKMPCDPAGGQKGQGEAKTCFEYMRKATNNKFHPIRAGNNNTQARWGAVKKYLNIMMYGEPGFKINARCKTIRKGMNGGYKNKRMQVSGTRFAETADKNHYSHIADAVQYFALYCSGGVDDDKPRQITADGDYNELGFDRKQTVAIGTGI